MAEPFDIADQIPPLQRLAVAYAPKELWRGQHLAWAFDARMSDIVRTTSEPMIGQMRLAWWREALRDGPAAGGGGEPLLDALRGHVLPGADAGDLIAVIDGWEELLEALPLGDSQLIAFAEHRGGGLFRLMGRPAGGVAPWLAQAGMGWALWDLAGHMSDRDTAARAMALVPEFLGDVPRRGWPGGLKPLRLLTGLARADAERGSMPPGRMTAGQYLRILRLALGRG